MYFESSRKTYYRFPSTNSIHEMDSKYYFPDKMYASGENLRQDATTDQSFMKQDSNILFK